MEYTKPEIEIVLFENLQDIVTASSDTLINNGVGGNEGGTWDDFTK